MSTLDELETIVDYEARRCAKSTLDVMAGLGLDPRVREPLARAIARAIFVYAPVAVELRQKIDRTRRVMAALRHKEQQMMTIDEYIEAQTEQVKLDLDGFRKFWKRQQETQPAARGFMKELDQEAWREQFLAYIEWTEKDA